MGDKLNGDTKVELAYTKIIQDIPKVDKKKAFEKRHINIKQMNGKNLACSLKEC